MECQIFLYFVAAISAVLAGVRYGPYHAAPYLVENHGNKVPEKVTSYFYLQRVNQTTTFFNGFLDIKQKIGPLQAWLDIVSWTGSGFKKSTGDKQIRAHPNGCFWGVSNILASFKPKGNFDLDNCILNPGYYEISIDFDALMHESEENYVLQPLRFVLNLHEEALQSMFGFTMELNIVRLDFYQLQLNSTVFD